MGDTVFAKGGQFIDFKDYNAYVLPYKAIWTQGDDIFSGALAFAGISSTGLGQIFGQQLWASASQLGQYNILIDYDHDGKFSWTLDGLGSFTVVPEPGTLALLVVALVAGMLQRRKCRIGLFRGLSMLA